MGGLNPGPPEGHLVRQYRPVFFILGETLEYQ